MVLIVFMVIMSSGQTGKQGQPGQMGHTEQTGQTGQTDLELEFPGNLCRAAFAILAMFCASFQATGLICNVPICFMLKFLQINVCE